MNSLVFKNLFLEAQKCYEKYKKYLQDDYSRSKTFSEYLCDAQSWFITTYDGEFAGFVLLDNFTGNDANSHSAEVSVFFSPKFWGVYTRYCAKIFLKKCFDEFNFYKIKAQVYSNNKRVSKLLKSSGFQIEGLLKGETLCGGMLQDIELYAIYRGYYYK